MGGNPLKNVCQAFIVTARIIVAREQPGCDSIVMLVGLVT